MPDNQLTCKICNNNSNNQMLKVREMYFGTREVFDYLEGNMDDIMWEQTPMQKLVEDKQLVAYRHIGFWKAMDILRDKVELEKMWQEQAPWKKW